MCARPLAAPVVWRRRLLGFAVLAGAVGWHFLARNSRTPLAGSADAVLVALVHNVAVFVRGVLPMLPANDYAAVAVTAVAGAVLFAMAQPLARFFLMWSVIAWLPYVVMTSGERFAYFFHVPAVLFAVQFTGDLARRWRRGPALLGGIWLLVAIAAALRLPAALDGHRRLGDECRRVWQFLDQHELARRPQLIVDAVPLCLENGFEALLDVFGGSRPQVVHLQVVRVPPFLLYLNRAFGAMPPSTPVLQLGSSDELRATDKAALVHGSVPLPILSLAGDYRLVADEAAARAALAEPGFDPAVRPLLYERPPCDIEPPGDYRIDNVAVDLRQSTCDVDCARPTLLSIAFPVTVDLERNGRILVDGVPVPVLRANVLFHAICLPAGRHQVTLRPALPGG